MILKARHILLRHEFEAKDVMRKLKEGVPFEELAKDFSICSSALRGGDLGEFRKGQTAPEFEKAVLKLNVSEVSDIVRTKFGYHIIQRTH